MLRIDSWFRLTTICSTNIASSIFYTRCTSLFTWSAAGDPLPSFHKVGWRKLWRRSDTASMLLGIYSPFLNRDYSLYYKCVKSAIERIWESSKITTCISVLPGKFPTFMTSFLTLWHHPPEGPFSPDGSHIYIYIVANSQFSSSRDTTVQNLDFTRQTTDITYFAVVFHYDVIKCIS